jgi:hypothetical protein
MRIASCIAARRYRRFVNGFENSPMQSMKSCAIGLSVRFLSEMIETGKCQSGNSIGSTLYGAP